MSINKRRSRSVHCEWHVQSIIQMLAGQGSVGLAGLLAHGAVPVALQAWQEGENHKADCQLTDVAVDFSSFVSYKITAMSPDSLADNVYFQRCLEGIRKRGLEVLWR